MKISTLAAERLSHLSLLALDSLYTDCGVAHEVEDGRIVRIKKEAPKGN